ncbi:MAG: hypothetical protein JWM57_1528, partial [Phycisphaerales bacterium]|nr:hypothetical protein [Phycisphaerales bacterium]
IPAAVLFADNVVVGNTQYLRQPNGTLSASAWTSHGYISWSSAILGKYYAIGDPAYQNSNNFQYFQCPSLDKGGLPPANTVDSNRDGWANEYGGVVDAQAPRLAYMLNEALAPRGRFGNNVNGSYPSPYHYVRAGRVKNSADTILATEMWQAPTLMQTASQGPGGNQVSNSRRPTSGFSISITNGATGVTTADKFYQCNNPEKLVQATAADVVADPTGDTAWVLSPIKSTLSFIGRNHGQKKLGVVQSTGGTTVGGWDLRKSNFLYLDGHVETKNVADTIYPANQWGDQFYSLVR